MSNEKEIIKLNHSTSSTEKGPIFHLEDDKLIIKYDWFNEQDRIYYWSVIEFMEVLKFQYTQESSCLAEDVVGFDQIVVYSNSPFWKANLSEWEKRIGKQSYQKELGGKERFKHFKIFFDSSCGVDVIASSYKLVEL